MDPAADEAIEYTYAFFIAHAGPDVDQAVRLYELLTEGGARAFVDERCLQPGDLWDEELPRAQRASRITVVLLSSHTDSAYYARQEIADAIQLVRRDARRVVPLYLEELDEAPYGLGRVHALSALDDAGLVDASKRLLDLIRPAVGTTGDDRIAGLFNPVPPVTRWFVGRDELVEMLTTPDVGREMTVRALVGMGGVGKTTLAADYAHAARDRCEVVWWVRAEEESNLVADLSALADEAGLQRGDEGELAARARQAHDWLSGQSEPWLVVFDNVQRPSDVEDWLPQGERGEVLITSRYRHVDDIASVITVDRFDDDLAADFLCRRVRGKDRRAAADEDGARAVAAALDGLPLALEQAGAYVARNPNRTWEDFLERFDEAGNVFSEQTKPRGYDATAFSTWQVSIDAAGAEAPLATRVMDVLSFFAPEAIPLDTLLADETADDPFLETDEDEDVEQALDVLHAYSLVQIQPGEVWVHRVVQDATRATAAPAAWPAAIRTVSADVPVDAKSPAAWSRSESLRPHVLALATDRGALDPPDIVALVWALDRLATSLQFGGAVHDALAVFQLALDRAEDGLGRDEVVTLRTRNNLALAYADAGLTDDAIRLNEEVLEDSERILGHDHPNTLTVRANLALGYSSVGRTEDAIELNQQVLDDRERLLGHDAPETLTSRSNLALAYADAGRTEDALELNQQVLDASERVLGHDHPDTLTSRSNLASSFFNAGRIDEAIELNKRVLADRERILGHDHPNTLTTRNNLAHSYWVDGQADEAIALMTLVLADRERVLGADHPHSRSSRVVLDLWRSDG